PLIRYTRLCSIPRPGEGNHALAVPHDIRHIRDIRQSRDRCTVHILRLVTHRFSSSSLIVSLQTCTGYPGSDTPGVHGNTRVSAVTLRTRRLVYVRRPW